MSMIKIKKLLFISVFFIPSLSKANVLDTFYQVYFAFDACGSAAALSGPEQYLIADDFRYVQSRMLTDARKNITEANEWVKINKENIQTINSVTNKFCGKLLSEYYAGVAESISFKK